MWLCERPAAVKRAAVEGGCRHLTPQITPAFVDSASSLMLVFCRCCTHLISHPTDSRWLKSLSAKQVIHVTIHAHKLSNTEHPTISTSTVSKKKREAQVFVHDLLFFVTVQMLADALAVLTSGKLCEGHGYTNELASSLKPLLAKDRKEYPLQD